MRRKAIHADGDTYKALRLVSGVRRECTHYQVAPALTDGERGDRVVG